MAHTVLQFGLSRTYRSTPSAWLLAAGLAAALAGCSSGSQGIDPAAGGAATASGGATSMAGAGAGAGAGGDAGSGGSAIGSGGSGASAGFTLGSSGAAGNGSSGATATGTTQCSDGIDNDGDGLIDGMDPECTGAADNDEGSYATGIPGDNRDPKWQDCFFDGNSGAGDDGCRYSTGCLDGTLPSTDPDCVLSQRCIDFCRPLTPNGCDCFGCCTVTLPGGSTLDVTLGASCSLDRASDPQACPRCTKSTQCSNDCGTCELCPGKTVADLPPSCGSTPPDGGTPSDAGTPPPTYTCDNGESVCGPGLPPCSSSEFCSFGCCIAIVP